MEKKKNAKKRTFLKTEGKENAGNRDIDRLNRYRTFERGTVQPARENEKNKVVDDIICTQSGASGATTMKGKDV